MPSEKLPPSLKIEVKSSRSPSFSLSSRDIEGISPDGYAAVLITDRKLKGPRWVFVPAGRLEAGSSDESTLAASADEGSCHAEIAEHVNRFWSNWMLDERVTNLLFKQENMGIRAAVSWCLDNHEARENGSKGVLRETKLAAALERFRAGIDEFISSANGPQEEGFVHQRILEQAFKALGYKVTNNPVGVPDFDARLQGGGTEERRDVRAAIESWEPASPRLVNVRSALLDASDDEIAELCKRLM